MSGFSPESSNNADHISSQSRQQIAETMQDCSLCPRSCHVNRLDGQRGYCGQTAELTAARAALHMWEEPCLSGREGSGTVFFSGCSLRCVFCQNHNIALGRSGRIISAERLADIFLELQDKGANNINLVTPTHFVPQIAAALELSIQRGLLLPVVYNTSSYEYVSTLRLLDGLVDIYLPDLKYFSSELSRLYSNAPDYFEHASAAIAEMVRQTGQPVFNPITGLMQKGVIIRHLILPGQVKDSKKIIRYLHETYGDSVYISIMNQYTPLPHVSHIQELSRPVSEEEYGRVIDFALRLGVEKGYLQEGESASESFIPEFDCDGI